VKQFGGPKSIRLLAQTTGQTSDRWTDRPQTTDRLPNWPSDKLTRWLDDWLTAWHTHKQLDPLNKDKCKTANYLGIFHSFFFTRARASAKRHPPTPWKLWDNPKKTICWRSSWLPNEPGSVPASWVASNWLEKMASPRGARWEGITGMVKTNRKTSLFHGFCNWLPWLRPQFPQTQSKAIEYSLSIFRMSSKKLRKKFGAY